MRTPTCSIILLCDGIHRCPTTGKVSALGIFSDVQAPEFPATTNFGLFVAMNDGFGHVPFRVEIVDADEERVLMRFDSAAEFPNPFHVHQFCGPASVEWPEAGTYLFRVLCDGVEIGCRWVNVTGPQVPA